MTTDETSPEDFKNNRGGDHSHIKGWGIDIDPKNDPTYPLKKRTDEEIKGYSWERSEQQAIDIEVLHSVERPNITAVFGTAAPPRGLSGMIRRHAFKKSESSLGRWVPLILADRIDMVEGVLDDLKQGYIPNFFEERGLKSEWKYNRKNFIVKTATVAAVASAAVLLLSRKSKK
ncbi:hypothetical protein [Autumnicola psychrophila]|uniref:Uncharacterized protein n=1 Tax=Autumnicola psychrophila TaxID=3075592 RepID=A0ABU3DMD1_9FLAO|nr:hypothetical protein [Zunongwangia sp. F225]MDT0684875.1 hypothetical protein [Zunongwangia sp. F225]